MLCNVAFVRGICNIISQGIFPQELAAGCDNRSKSRPGASAIYYTNGYVGSNLRFLVAGLRL